MNKGVSIFLIPVFILVLSIVSTFIDNNSILKKLYSGAQTAGSLVYDPSQERGDARAEPPTDTIPVDAQETTQAEELPIESTPTDPTIPPEIITNEITTATEPLETSGNTSAETTDIVPTENASPTEDTPPNLTVIPEIIPPQETATTTEPEVATVTEDILQKQNQFILTRQNIRTKYEVTLSQIEKSQKELVDKIESMKTAGQDTTQAEEALARLDQSIDETKHSIRSTTLPKTIPDLQKGILNYIIGIRPTIDSTMSALKDALNITQ